MTILASILMAVSVLFDSKSNEAAEVCYEQSKAKARELAYKSGMPGRW